MFRTVSLSIIRSLSLYTQQWYMSYRFSDSLRAGSGRTCFGHFLCPSSGVFNCTHSKGMSYRFADTLRAASGRTCFGHFLCPSSGVFNCTHSNGICHTGLLTACEQDQDGIKLITHVELPLSLVISKINLG